MEIVCIKSLDGDKPSSFDEELFTGNQVKEKFDMRKLKVTRIQIIMKG